MTPQQLGEYLDVLKAKRVAQAGLEIPWDLGNGAMWPVKLSVVFGPEPLEMDVGTKTDATPGGWKGDSGLDPSYADEVIP